MLVDDEGVGIDVAVLRVVADGADFHAFRQRAEVELRAVRRRVARQDALAVDPELDAFHRRLDFHLDNKQVRRDVASRRDDLHRAAALRREAFGQNRFGVVAFLGNIRGVRLRDRERLRRLRQNHRRLLFERNHQLRVDFRIARLERLHRGQRVRRRRFDRITEALHDLAVLRDRAGQDERNAGRRIGRNREAIRDARDDAALRGIAERFYADVDFPLGGENGDGEKEQRDQRTFHPAILHVRRGHGDRI